MEAESKIEIWKPIKGYEGLYCVSNLGRIKSLSRKVKNFGGHFKITKDKIVSGTKRKGYVLIALCNGIDVPRTKYSVHRLILSAFITPESEDLDVNHINGIKDDNRLENLEWCTRSQNLKHAYDSGLHLPKKYKGECDIPCVSISKTGERVLYKSAAEAGRRTGINSKNITSALRGNRNSAGKLKWERA